MRIPALAVVLALAGCAGGPGPQAQTFAEVPRDARGEPVLTAIAPPVTGAPQAATIPSAPIALPPRAKPVSCQHYKRCL